MPYIDKHRRDTIVKPETPGELNFMITELLISYMNENGLNYGTINDIVGACEGAKLEFYRRVAVPYEDIKIKQNGDVY
jgi:hypothetical protein